VTTCDGDAVLIDCIEGDLVAASEAAGPKDRMCRASTDTRKPVNLLTRREEDREESDNDINWLRSGTTRRTVVWSLRALRSFPWVLVERLNVQHAVPV